MCPNQRSRGHGLRRLPLHSTVFTVFLSVSDSCSECAAQYRPPALMPAYSQVGASDMRRAAASCEQRLFTPLAVSTGLLVVSESPCVGLSFADAPAIVQQRQAQGGREGC